MSNNRKMAKQITVHQLDGILCSQIIENDFLRRAEFINHSDYLEDKHNSSFKKYMWVNHVYHEYSACSLKEFELSGFARGNCTSVQWLAHVL